MHGDGRRAAAFLTASFGVGQMVGPVFAGILADLREGFAMPLMAAAACTIIAGFCVAVDRCFRRT